MSNIKGSFTGRKHTDETKEKISKSKSGVKRTQKQRVAQSLAQKHIIYSRSLRSKDDPSIVREDVGVCTIYKLTNKASKKIYIGQTWKTCEERMKDGSGYKNSPYLYNAILKDGHENFVYEILATATYQEEADELETKYINEYNSTDPSIGYNLASGGSHGKHSQATKDKISRSLSGKNAPWYGKHLSEDTKQKLREKALKREVSDEAREAMSRAGILRHQKFKHPMAGNTHTPEAIEKISQSSKELWKKEGYKENISDIRKGRIISVEQKKAWSAIQKEAQSGANASTRKKREPNSQETKNKRAASRRAYTERVNLINEAKLSGKPMTVKYDKELTNFNIDNVVCHICNSKIEPYFANKYTLFQCSEPGHFCVEKDTKFDDYIRFYFTLGNNLIKFHKVNQTYSILTYTPGVKRPQIAEAPFTNVDLLFKEDGTVDVNKVYDDVMHLIKMHQIKLINK